MKTNHLMLIELLEKYHPVNRGIISHSEMEMVKETLHIKEMDILALRNLRDFIVARMSHSKKNEDWDRMSAIVYVIDCQIVTLGGEV